MTLAEAFEVLGLPEDADAKAIKRAYHELLRRFKPDRDPQGFRRLRDAFEVATEAAAMRAFRLRVEVPEPDPEPERLPEVDPDVVLAALDRGAFAWAYDLVMDPRWATAMLDEVRGPLHWATRRVGLAVLLEHRPAFDALLAKYPEVFGGDDPYLIYLLRVGPSWSRLRSNVPLPAPLVAFATRAPTETDPGTRRTLARALGEWIADNLDEALRLVDLLDNHTHEVAPFLAELATEFETELDASAPQDDSSPEASLRPLTRTTNVLAVAASLCAFAFGQFPDGLLWGTVLRLTIPSLCAVGIVYAEAQIYAAFPSLRRRFLAACLEADMEPRLAAFRLGGHPFLRRALVRDEALALAFTLGRLARLA